MLYAFIPSAHINVSPVIVPGVAGIVFTVIANDFTADEPQSLFAVTVIFPDKVLAVVIIEFVIEDPVHPEGKVHVYDVAPFTGAMLYSLIPDAQMFVSPLILSEIVGAEFTVTDNICTADKPQSFLAETVMFPLVLFAVAVIEFMVDEPVQPTGNVHI
jgi:hypothetical protein